MSYYLSATEHMHGEYWGISTFEVTDTEAEEKKIVICHVFEIDPCINQINQ